MTGGRSIRLFNIYQPLKRQISLGMFTMGPKTFSIVKIHSYTLTQEIKMVQKLKSEQIGIVQVSIPGLIDLNLITQSSSPIPIWKWS